MGTGRPGLCPLAGAVCAASGCPDCPGRHPDGFAAATAPLPWTGLNRSDCQSPRPFLPGLSHPEIPTWNDLLQHGQATTPSPRKSGLVSSRLNEFSKRLPVLSLWTYLGFAGSLIDRRFHFGIVPSVVARRLVKILFISVAACFVGLKPSSPCQRQRFLCVLVHTCSIPFEFFPSVFLKEAEQP